MTDQTPTNPNTGDSASSDEYGFDPERRPLEETDSAQAEAAEYGIYGYTDHAGKEVVNQEAPPPDPGPVEEDSTTDGVSPEAGGQGHRETEHGAGFDQPMASPQRSVNSEPPTT